MEEGDAGFHGGLRLVRRLFGGVSVDAVWVDHPVERAAVAEPIVMRGGGDAFEREPVVVGERGLVLGKFHPLDAPGGLHALCFDALQLKFLLRLVAGVERDEFFAGLGKGGEIGGERNARQFTAEVGGEFLAVGRMMENDVNALGNQMKVMLAKNAGAARFSQK